MFALQTEGGFALIVGCACGHPYLLCNLFTFGNSNGSTDWLPPPEMALVLGPVGAAAVISHMCKVRTSFCSSRRTSYA
jgi:hypothetical protein